MAYAVEVGTRARGGAGPEVSGDTVVGAKRGDSQRDLIDIRFRCVGPRGFESEIIDIDCCVF